MRSTPIQELEKTADLKPLESGHEHKAALQGLKLKRQSSYQLHRKLQHGTKNPLKKKNFKHQLKDLQRKNADLLELADPRLPEVRTDIPRKGTEAPELQKALALEMCRIAIPRAPGPTSLRTGRLHRKRCQECRQCCLDGRKDGTIFSLSIPAGDLSSSFRAQLHVLKAATAHLIQEV